MSVFNTYNLLSATDSSLSNSAIEQTIDKTIVISKREGFSKAITKVVHRSDLDWHDNGAGNSFTNSVVADCNVLLLEQTILDCRVLDHSEVVAIDTVLVLWP